MILKIEKLILHDSVKRHKDKKIEISITTKNRIFFGLYLIFLFPFELMIKLVAYTLIGMFKGFFGFFVSDDMRNNHAILLTVLYGRNYWVKMMKKSGYTIYDEVGE